MRVPTRTLTTDTKEEYLRQLADRITAQQPRAQQQKLIAFMRDYFRNVPLRDLEQREVQDSHAQTLASWEFLQQFQSAKPKVAVFNPDPRRQQWHCTHSVVMVLHADIPFLVDSVRMELTRQEIMIQAVQSLVSQVKRDAGGKLKERLPMNYRQGEPQARPGYQVEAFAYYEIDRILDAEAMRMLEQSLAKVLADVRVVVDDFGAMKARVMEVLASLENNAPPFPPEELEETRTFLQWLLEDNFTFLGAKEYAFVKTGRRELIKHVPASALGIVKRKEKSTRDKYLSDLSPKLRKFLRLPRLSVFAKSGTLSTVHRPAYPEYIGIRRYNAKGQAVGEYGFLGLFTLPVYAERIRNIPILRRKADEIMRRSQLYPRSHEGKALLQVLETFPRDELFLTDIDELYETVTQIAQIKERHQIRLFVREGHYGKFFSCFVYMPREIYNTEIRQKIQTILVRHFKALHAEFTTYFGESILVRTHFVLRKDPKDDLEYDVKALEQEIVAVTRSWQDQLEQGLIAAYGEEQGLVLARRFHTAFPAGYRDGFSAEHGVRDVQYMLSLNLEQPLALRFYREANEQPDQAHFTLYHLGSAVPLSDIIPVLENTGLKVIGERPFRLVDQAGNACWVHDFSLVYRLGSALDADALQEVFVHAIAQIWNGMARDDSFNRLILALGLNWRQVSYLRALAHYMTQLRLGLSHDYVADTLLRHQELTRIAVDYFYHKFDPRRQQSGETEPQLQNLEERYLKRLDGVQSLSEDRVLRRYLELVKAMLRTNFFQTDALGQDKPWFAFKFDPQQIPNIPFPRPLFEIFVYSTHMEGVHLRGGKVARGGLRWSDRLEDYRTEVLGLVKAQQVKNAVIVPVGAKGGFVANRTAHLTDRNEIRVEGIRSYKTLISGMLDITDNLLQGKVVPPPQVVRYDEDDPYLVVAADKGTATFSDIANAIAADYGFWLGDAFASGGSQGYDHKAMGITARGAWIAVQRHFRELGLDTQRQDFSVIGIGDMSGDVFGNGMLLSQHIRLLAAFNHMHIFIDPDPDPRRSFAERERLFGAERGGWGEYDSQLISKGGGVFLRSAKAINITPEMRRCFGITATALTPNELIHALLQAPVDLLWNGGIGTYVKSSQESHEQVGDKANDAVRVNGGELRARVIGEGGNLGMTQLGRIEYAVAGGRCFTDFIDNAGGVDCSDHEVNIKILLNVLMQNGKLKLAERNKLLLAMTEEVAELVLQNNYRQTQAISIAQAQAAGRMHDYLLFIQRLEEQGRLNRALEFLPSNLEFKQRQQADQPLTRPELAILISYAKAELKELLSQTNIIDDPYLRKEMLTAFPPKLIKKYGETLFEHSLRREIAATQLANDLVNSLGITFAANMLDQVSVGIEDVAKAYVIARDVFRLPAIWRQIEALDNQVPAEVQLEMMSLTAGLVRYGARWLLKHRCYEGDTEQVIARYLPAVALLERGVSKLSKSDLFQDWDDKYQRLSAAGVPQPLANFVAAADTLYFAFDITEAMQITGKSLGAVATTFFHLSHRLELYGFRQRISALKATSRWQSRARAALRDDLDAQLRTLTKTILAAKLKGNEAQQVEAWLAHEPAAMAHWRTLLEDMRETENPDLAMYTVAVKELVQLERHA